MIGSQQKKVKVIGSEIRLLFVLVLKLKSFFLLAYFFLVKGKQNPEL